MVPLYLARIEDLGPGDFVKIDCAACSKGFYEFGRTRCSHTALLSTAFLSRLGLNPRDKVLDLRTGCGTEAAAREVGRSYL